MLSVSAALCSCKKQSEAPVVQESERVPLNFCAAPEGLEYGTKASTEMTNEQTLANVVFMVYNADGTLDAMSNESGKSTTTLNVTKADGKTLVAIANPSATIGSQYPTVDLMDDLKTESLTQVFQAPTKGHVMIGREEGYDLSGEIEGSVEIPVKRLISKVSIEKITNSLAPGLGNIVIKEIFLANAPMSAYYFKTDPTYEWAHLNGKNLTTEPMLRSTMDVIVPNGQSSTDVQSYFYCYPNTCKEDNPGAQGAAASRYTRLVVKAEILGTEYFYPVSINSFTATKTMTSNMHYKIKELTIKHVGGNDPDVPIQLEAVGFEVSVTPWETTELSPEI